MKWKIILSAFLVFLADYYIKSYLRLNLAFESIPIIPGFFRITVIFNDGAAFGFLRGKATLLLILSLAFVVFLLFLIFREKKISTFEAILYGMIIGGALSNIYDRLFLGYVVDYLDIRYAGKNIWPVFNLADSCITVGVILMVLIQLRRNPLRRAE